MAHALGVRATSLGAAALVLGIGLFAALNMSYRIVDWAAPDLGPAIDMAVEPAQPPPTEQPRVQNPLREPVEELQTLILPADPFTDTDAQPVETNFAPSNAAPVEITAPDWISRPRDLAAYYPRRALERGVEGVVQLDCRVSVVGELHCVVRSETPQNMGFGAAALRIAADHRMHPARRDGLAVEGRYSMRVPFALH